MTRYDKLPPGLVPRGLTREAAASYAGLSPTRFDAARAKGQYPNPSLPGGRYDLLTLQMAMNRLSGLNGDDESLKPLDSWKAGRRARKT